MSQYAYIVCHDCRSYMFLGKVIQPESDPSYLQAGTVPNSEDLELTRALWKFIADNIGHSVAVVSDFSDDFDRITEYSKIGGDAIDDVTIEDYLADFRG